MQTVQQTQQQTEQYTLGTNLIPTEQCQQLLPRVATDSEEDSGTSNSLDITHQDNSLHTTQQDNTQPEPQISHIQTPTSTTLTPTSPITNSTPTTTQSDYPRQSYRVPSYYVNSLSYVNSRRRR